MVVGENRPRVVLINSCASVGRENRRGAQNSSTTPGCNCRSVMGDKRAALERPTPQAGIKRARLDGLTRQYRGRRKGKSHGA